MVKYRIKLTQDEVIELNYIRHLKINMTVAYIASFCGIGSLAKTQRREGLHINANQKLK